MTKRPNPHILAIVEATAALDKVLANAAAFEATQDRSGAMVEDLRLEISRKVSTQLHNLTLGTSAHETYAVVR